MQRARGDKILAILEMAGVSSFVSILHFAFSFFISFISFMPKPVPMKTKRKQATRNKQLAKKPQKNRPVKPYQNDKVYSHIDNFRHKKSLSFQISSLFVFTNL